MPLSNCNNIRIGPEEKAAVVVLGRAVPFRNPCPMSSGGRRAQLRGARAAHEKNGPALDATTIGPVHTELPWFVSCYALASVLCRCVYCPLLAFACVSDYLVYACVFAQLLRLAASEPVCSCFSRWLLEIEGSLCISSLLTSNAVTL